MPIKMADDRRVALCFLCWNLGVDVGFPPGLKVMPHWHPDEWRTAVVLSGTLYFGVGEQWDESRLKAYPAGTFYSEPPRTPHYIWAKDGEVIIQTTGMGPTGTTMIPQKQ
jgi:quercetin dioxygenase-like cupin family protein